jgi:hypothetical protein
MRSLGSRPGCYVRMRKEGQREAAGACLLVVRDQAGAVRAVVVSSRTTWMMLVAALLLCV